MKIVSVIFLFHCFLFVSCVNNEPTQVGEEIQISIKDLECDTIKVADWVTELEIIPLECKSSCMIGEPKKFIVTDKGFLIHDWQNGNEKVLYFDKQGNFLNKIGDIGRSKKEYYSIYTLTTDRKGDSIFISCCGRKNMLYDCKGNYIISKDQGFDHGLIDYSVKIPSGYICASIYSGPDYQLHVYDKDLNLVDELLPTNGIITRFPSWEFDRLRINDNKLIYCDFHYSTFNCIDLLNRKQVVRYHFIDDDMFSLDRVKEDFEDSDLFIYNSINDFYIEEDNIICSILDPNSQSNLISINTKTNKINRLIYDGWMPEINDYYKGYYYIIMEQTEFLELVEEHDYESEPTDSEFAQILKKVYKSSGLKIDEKSNFVIIKFKG